MELKKASRKQSKLRIWLSAPSGAGKTYSALILAKWMVNDWSKIALIDTENWSWDLYSDLWEYNVLQLNPPYSPERYIEAIQACEDAGMEVIIIDSISHEWEWKWWCLELNEQIANSKFKWNTWSAWSVTKPRHQKFIEAITQSKCHIISTVRNKVETAQIEWKIKKVGTKEITQEWYEYELTLNFTIDRDSHNVSASKDRTGLFIDKDPFIITQDVWKRLIEWNQSWKKILTTEEKQQANYSNLFEIFTHIENKEMFDKEVKSFKENLAKDTTFISKNQLNEIWEIVNNLKNSFEEKKQRFIW